MIKMPVLPIVAALILLTSISWATDIGAAEMASQEEIETKLKSLEDEISNFKESLENTTGEKSNLEENLQRNEKGISDLINKIEDIEREISTGKDKVSTLVGKQKELLAAKSEQQHYIERQIRAAYEIGNQEYLKVLLNQEDPAEMARMLNYYDYFNEARSKQIRTYNTTIEELGQITDALVEENNLLTQNRSELVDEQTNLAATQSEKRAALKALLLQIAVTGSEITKRESDRNRLEQLLNKIQSTLASLPSQVDVEPFSGMRGKLVLPVAGNVSRRFGMGRSNGKQKWNGVLIDAAEGDSVHAVHYGRVVFSDWLRGFGLLVIINHGEGYMSLYGHNQVLYRETGDWVRAGESIATVGDSGGQSKSGLYFEIRIAGKPSDPQKWCMARQQRAV